MAITSTSVVEIRTTGSDTLNSGGYDSAFTGVGSSVDYSQQNSAQYTLTGATTAGVSATVAQTSASADMVGNWVQITAGTNFTTGFYVITSVSAGVSLTLDRNCTTGVGAAGTLRIGGALANIGTVGSLLVAGNTAWIKSGSYTPGASEIITVSGSVSLPILIRGYGTTRGDGYQNRTNNTGSLVSTNFPTITYSGTFSSMQVSGTFVIINTIQVVSARSSFSLSLGANCSLKSCIIVNTSTNVAAVGLTIGSSGGECVDCDISLTGVSGGSSALVLSGSNARAIGCKITGGPAVGIAISSSVIVSFCTIYNSTGFNVSITSTSAVATIMFCTIVGSGSDGVNIVTSAVNVQVILDCMITDNLGYGLNMVSTSNAAFLWHNRYRDNTSGNIGNAGGWITATDYAAVTSGNGTSDYTNAAGNDYTLISASPAVGAAKPYAASIGAYQRPSSVASGGFIIGG